MLPLATQSEERAARERSSQRGASSAGAERFLWNKLITGGFRVGVSQQLVVRALSRRRAASTKGRSRIG